MTTKEKSSVSGRVLAPNEGPHDLSDVIGSWSADSPVAIFMHRTPDPDSMGASLAFQWLLKKRFGISSTIFREGEVSHPQNKTMVNILGITMSRVEEYNPEEYQARVVLDATPRNSSVDKADVIIDHHRIEDDPEGQFVQIEPVGSVCTLIYEHIQNLEMAFDDEIDETVATSLLLGIRSDTQDLISENATDRDFSAFRELSPYINRKKLQGILTYPLPVYLFELEGELSKEENRVIEHACFIGSIGMIAQGKRDSLPMLAEKMVRMDGIDTAIIFAIVGDHLEVSLRSQNPSLDVNAFAQKVFGRDFGGGKLGQGAARVPMGIFSLVDSPEDLRTEIWGALKKQLFHKILHVAGGN